MHITRIKGLSLQKDMNKTYDEMKQYFVEWIMEEAAEMIAAYFQKNNREREVDFDSELLDVIALVLIYFDFLSGKDRDDLICKIKLKFTEREPHNAHYYR